MECHKGAGQTVKGAERETVLQTESASPGRFDDSVYVGVGEPQEVKTTGPELASPLRKRTMTSVVAGEGVSLTDHMVSPLPYFGYGVDMWRALLLIKPSVKTLGSEHLVCIFWSC